MYVTAQRVYRIEGRHRQGINGFLYPHEDREIAHTDSGQPDVEAVAEHPPGEPAERIYSLKPGGNGVLSYLDVTCPDDTSLDRLRAAFSRFDDVVPREIGEYTFEHTEIFEGIGVRIYLSPRTILSPDLEYRSLSETVIRLIAMYRGMDVSTLRINRDKIEDTWQFRRLTGKPDDRAITIDRETRRAFEHTGGSVYSMVAENLFDRTPEQLLEHGGVEVMDVHSGDIIWRGP